MAIRFQVDPDFYDHPKALGMSDAATALWVRAGSYSAAKLLDGFVPENVLSLLTTAPEEASGELVRRGLWKRVKGGFRFHEWAERNLTRARVTSDREYDRARKRRERQAARQNGNAQVNTANVRTGHRPDSEPDSERNPNRSVSVSVSESVSGSGQRQRASPTPGPEPPQACPQHIGDPDPPRCGACADARRRHQQWQADQARADAAARSAHARQRAELRQAEIAACTRCDTDGRLPSGAVCRHTPTSTTGAAAARAALTRKEPL